MSELPKKDGPTLEERQLAKWLDNRILYARRGKMPNDWLAKLRAIPRVAKRLSTTWSAHFEAFAQLLVWRFVRTCQDSCSRQFQSYLNHIRLLGINLETCRRWSCYLEVLNKMWSWWGATWASKVEASNDVVVEDCAILCLNVAKAAVVQPAQRFGYLSGIW